MQEIFVTTKIVPYIHTTGSNSWRWWQWLCEGADYDDDCDSVIVVVVDVVDDDFDEFYW